MIRARINSYRNILIFIAGWALFLLLIGWPLYAWLT